MQKYVIMKTLPFLNVLNNYYKKKVTNYEKKLQIMKVLDIDVFGQNDKIHVDEE